MNALTFDSRFSNNAVYILDCLKSSELQTAKHLYEELGDLKYETETPYCSIVPIASRAELLSALDQVRELCVDGIRPIIHIEAHGGKSTGIVLGDKEEQVSWVELASCLGKINEATTNNLGVVMAGCFGLYAIQPIKITKPSPFYFLIGSDEKVSAGEIDDVMKKFYRVLFKSNSLQTAMKEVDERFKQFHVEKMFCVAFGRYIKQQCVGQGRSARVEKLLSQLVENGMPRNRENLRNSRKKLKQLVKPSKAAFDKYAKLFMHGRYAITYEQLHEFVTRKA
ncbi:hypothetical protein AzCIB_3419 [Azoarcus sp. CIB]|uniref:hypothetical protein n=1 Tax=Aromatoleum sp. (strain CIB) TaxID=198107 RepID=UPI00067B6A39|nr:hypothetical protein [Azoarcus sp. CIB]AKU13312.1 hypothetical protein AzCIB_3419 [Azoarcus sp. CIB]